MPPRYSSIQKVADHLGLEFSGLQAVEAERALLAAEAWIDGRTGRAWEAALAPITDLLTVTGQGAYLDRAPVTSVASVEVRSRVVGAAWTPLAAGSYELLDAGTGLLLLPWGYAGWWLRAVYTPAAAVDPRLALAATKLAAHWIAPVLSAGASAAPIKSYSLGSELTVTYDSGAASASAASPVAGVPADVVALVDGLRDLVLA